MLARVRENVQLLLIAALSALLNVWALGKEGFSNPYYAAAVRSMLASGHHFFFNSFDPMGYITIDKPPLGFWLQVASAKVFGYQGWSLLLPQALAGVGSVVMLYVLVNRVFGKPAGLISALIMALTPIAVAISRNNSVDMTLVFFLLVAVWLLHRGMERQSVSWIGLSALTIGLAFNIKMFQAFLILPAVLVVYVLAYRVEWRKKWLHFAVASVVLAVVSFSWATIVELTPKENRPYIGSSQTNSVFELILGYNGINRFTGDKANNRADDGGNQAGKEAGQGGPVGQGAIAGGPGQGGPNGLGGQGGPGGEGENGAKGILRLWNAQSAGQISWLLAFALMSAVIGLWGSWRDWLRSSRKQWTIFWLVWLLPMMVFFSFASFYHRYYLVMLAPAISALAGIGLSQFKDGLNRYIEDRRGSQLWWWVLAIGVNIGVEAYIVARSNSLVLVLCSVMGMATVVAAWFIGRSTQSKTNATLNTNLIVPLVLVAFLSGPYYWCFYTTQNQMNATLPVAGPNSDIGNRPNPNIGNPPNANTGTPPRMDMGSSNPKLMAFLKSNARVGTYLLFTQESHTASPYIIEAGLSVSPMGGFNGGDPAMTVDKLNQLAAAGKLQYFLVNDARNPGGPGGGPMGNINQDVHQWIRQHCQEVPTELWNNSPDRNANGNPSANGNPNRNPNPPQQSAQKLYEFKS